VQLERVLLPIVLANIALLGLDLAYNALAGLLAIWE